VKGLSRTAYLKSPAMGFSPHSSLWAVAFGIVREEKKGHSVDLSIVARLVRQLRGDEREEGRGGGGGGRKGGEGLVALRVERQGRPWWEGKKGKKGGAMALDARHRREHRPCSLAVFVMVCRGAAA